jgi:3-deoxy-manno-octulosonate cytidylyltransferase (CMP-KDO synthetase)
MQIIGIIPARYASTRFPGKPLVEIDGKTMIQRVYEQATKAKVFDKIIVATDDDRIVDCVKSFGGNVVMTSVDHQSGTDRCAEVIKIERDHYDYAINIQGDEPFIHPEQIKLLVKCISQKDVQIATLVKEIKSIEELNNTNAPKVILNINDEAIYFSRAAIPVCRGIDNNEWLKHNTYFKHIGLYAYKTDILLKITKLKPSKLELCESLEQLRWIENGYKIKTEVTTFESQAIDTPEDLKKLINTK